MLVFRLPHVSVLVLSGFPLGFANNLCGKLQNLVCFEGVQVSKLEEFSHEILVLHSHVCNLESLALSSAFAVSIGESHANLFTFGHCHTLHSPLSSRTQCTPHFDTPTLFSSSVTLHSLCTSHFTLHTLQSTCSLLDRCPHFTLQDVCALHTLHSTLVIPHLTLLPTLHSTVSVGDSFTLHTLYSTLSRLAHLDKSPRNSFWGSPLHTLQSLHFPVALPHFGDRLHTLHSPTPHFTLPTPHFTCSSLALHTFHSTLSSPLAFPLPSQCLLGKAANLSHFWKVSKFATGVVELRTLHCSSWPLVHSSLDNLWLFTSHTSTVSPLGDSCFHFSEVSIHVYIAHFALGHFRVALGDSLQSTLYTPHSALPHSTLLQFAINPPHSTLRTSHFTLLHFTLYIPHFTLPMLYTSHSTLHTSHCTLYTQHSDTSTLYTSTPPHFRLYTVTLHTLHFTLYTSHSTLSTHTQNSTLHTLQTLHFTLHTLLFTLHNPHFTLHTLHSTLYTLHSHTTLYTLHSTLHTLHSTLYTPHFTLRTPHSTLYTPHFIVTFGHFLLQRKPLFCNLCLDICVSIMRVSIRVRGLHLFLYSPVSSNMEMAGKWTIEITTIFRARNLHSVRGFSSPCLMKPEGTSHKIPLKPPFPKVFLKFSYCFPIWILEFDAEIAA